MPDDIYRYLSVEDLRKAFRQHETSSRSATESALELAQRVGRQLVAVSALCRHRATREAAAADARLREGHADTLTGIPYGAKDIISARGAPTSWGAPSLIDRVIHSDATVVARLADAGCALVAKLVTTSLAGAGGHVVPGISAHGQPRNPWDPRRFAGSSSSGPAIAVAQGIVPFALGTETGGSIIQPAAFCGVTGYRPTFGLIPRTGTMMLSPRLDKIGVIARTAEDCATVGRVLIGPDGHDAYVWNCHAFEKPPVSRVTDVRLGSSPREFAAMAPATRPLIERGIATLSSIVAERRDVEIASSRQYGRAIELLITVDAAASLAQFISDPSFRLPEDSQLERLQGARNHSAIDYAEADRARDRAAQDFQRVFEHTDVVVSASYPRSPQSRRRARSPRRADTVSQRLLAAANLAGLPGVSVPCGLDVHGLPVGLHLVGPRYSDLTLLRLAGEYQRITNHHLATPPDTGDAVG